MIGIGAATFTTITGCASLEGGDRSNAGDDTATTGDGSPPKSGTETEEETPTSTETPENLPLSEVSGVPMLGYNARRQNATSEDYGAISGFKRRWKKKLYPSGRVAQPIVMDGRVYTSPSKEFSEKPVYALTTTGDEIWTFSPDSASAGHPTVVGDTVVVGTRGKSAGTIHGLSTADGSERWQIETGDFGTGLAPAASDGTLYFTGTKKDGTGSNSLYAYSIDNQSEIWSSGLDSEPESAPVVTENTVAVSTGDKLAGLNRKTGAKRWSVPKLTSGGLDANHPIAANGTYIGLERENERLVAISASDGQTKWTADMRARPSAVTEESVIAFDLDSRTLFAASLTDGEIRWESDFDFRFAKCATTNQTVYATGYRSHKMVALSLADGKKQAQTSFPAPARIPVVADGYVFLAVGNTLFVVETN